MKRFITLSTLFVILVLSIIAGNNKNTVHTNIMTDTKQAVAAEIDLNKPPFIPEGWTLGTQIERWGKYNARPANPVTIEVDKSKNGSRSMNRPEWNVTANAHEIEWTLENKVIPNGWVDKCVIFRGTGYYDKDKRHVVRFLCTAKDNGVVTSYWGYVSSEPNLK